MSQESALGNEELFGGEAGDDLELSDFEGDQGSADEKDYNDDGGNANDEAVEDNDDEEEEETIMRRPKLPSFKKANRESTQDDDPDLERMREELRSRKQGTTGEEGEIKGSQPPGELDPGQAFLEVFDRYSEKVMSSGKRKRKKADEEDLERAMDDELSALREKMKVAAEMDNQSNNERKPATAKLKMLHEASALLTLDAAQDSILDNQLLDTIRLWLEPLPDRSLPSLDIQNAMLDILNSLTMSSGHLRESGVGKIVYFYQKSPRVDSRVRRKAEQLVAKWSRLVIKRSDNYRERMHEKREYSREEMLQRRKRYRPENDREESNSSDPRRMHVRIPQAVAPDYDIIPQSTVKKAGRIKSKEQGTLKRLTNTIRSMKK